MSSMAGKSDMGHHSRLLDTGESGTRPETRVGGVGGSKLGYPRPIICPDLISLPFSCYAFRISRLDSTRSIKGRMPKSLEIANDSACRKVALARSPSLLRSRRRSA